jgi:hypothetical protein
MFPYKFSVGEVAIAIDPGGYFDGMECVIVEGLHRDTGMSLHPERNGRFEKGMMYTVRFAECPHAVLAFPHELRKKRPPEMPVNAEQDSEALV